MTERDAMHHDVLVKEARKAVFSLFGDGKPDETQTIQDLVEIKCIIDDMINSLRNQLAEERPKMEVDDEHL